MVSIVASTRMLARRNRTRTGWLALLKYPSSLRNASHEIATRPTKQLLRSWFYRLARAKDNLQGARSTRAVSKPVAKWNEFQAEQHEGIRWSVPELLRISAPCTVQERLPRPRSRGAWPVAMPPAYRFRRRVQRRSFIFPMFLVVPPMPVRFYLLAFHAGTLWSLRRGRQSSQAQ